MSQSQVYFSHFSPVKAVSRKRKRRVIADDDNNSNDSFEIVSGVVPEHDDVDEVGC